MSIESMAAPTDQPAALAGRDFVAWNETMVERYDIDRYYERSHPVVRWLERQRLSALFELAAARPGDRVLEVGCGAGHVLQQFTDARRTGIDLSAGMVARARTRLGQRAELARASGDRLPFASHVFDVVLCTEVLEHVQDPGAVIAELVRVARPGARIVVSIPNEANIDRIKRALRRIPGVRSLLRTLASEGNEWHLHHFDVAMLERLVQGQANVARLRAIPGRYLPLRYVALLQADAQQRRSA
jgi:SAM-dependent methyltransferase